MKKIKYGKILACLIASLAIVCGNFTPISAAKDDKFSISTRDWVNELGVIHPGEIIHGTFSVINVGSEGFKYTMSADPYQASDDIGTTYSLLFVLILYTFSLAIIYKLNRLNISLFNNAGL